VSCASRDDEASSSRYVSPHAGKSPLLVPGVPLPAPVPLLVMVIPIFGTVWPSPFLAWVAVQSHKALVLGGMSAHFRCALAKNLGFSARSVRRLPPRIEDKGGGTKVLKNLGFLQESGLLFKQHGG
jgi:hypothetical protein